MKFIDLTGQKFGRLTVIERSDVKKKDIHWVCKCDCGNITIVNGMKLKTGRTKSCGCFRVELQTTHGLSKHPLYEVWHSMNQRCDCPSSGGYYNYGGRGIVVCEEWKNDFLSFFEWSIRNGWQPDLTIDRVDVNGNYEPGNCRWATRKEQANNRRTNHHLTYKGKTQTITDWAMELGITSNTLCERLNSGWTVERALSTPKK